MDQVRQQAALQNARALVEVSTFPSLQSQPTYLTLRSEGQRALLRALRPETRLLSLLGRNYVLHSLHGKVHEILEHHLTAVPQPRAKRCGESGRFRGLSPWRRRLGNWIDALAGIKRHWKGVMGSKTRPRAVRLHVHYHSPTVGWKRDLYNTDHRSDELRSRRRRGGLNASIRSP